MNTGNVRLVPEPVKTRRYDNARRAQQSLRTRRAVLAAALELVTAQGYQRTTIADIAARAGVNADTVYRVVGRKPDLMTELVETAISGQSTAVPAEERDYVRRIEAAGTAAEKVLIYAGAVAAIQERLAPVFLALRDAASTDEDLRSLWARIDGRRAENMRRFAASLRASGGVRTDLTDEQVADIVWSMNSAEYWDLLVTRRGWTAGEVAAHLADAWIRLLLEDADDRD